MTPERTAALVGRWTRFYTRGLPSAVGRRRVDEVDADLVDHIAHERARGTSDRRIALGIASRMVRGLAADAAWREGVITGHPWTSEEARRRGRTAYRRGAGMALAATLVLVWLIGAVGLIGDSGDSPDLMYAGVLVVGVVGSLAARFRPQGMARVLVAMAAVQVSVGVIALIAGMVPSYNSPLEILALSGFFGALFIGSAWLFRRADRHQARSGGR